MIGEKDQRIQIQVPTETTNAEGHPVKKWTSYLDLWAHVRTIGTREFESLKNISSEITDAFTVNYRKDLAEQQANAEVPTVKMRILWLGDYWNINGVKRSNQNRFDMDLLVSRVK